MPGIKDMVSQETILKGLAEEAAELTHAALKLLRVIEGQNPSGYTLGDATKHLNEEIADCRLYIEHLDCVDEDVIYEFRKRKLARWALRLMLKKKQEEG